MQDDDEMTYAEKPLGNPDRPTHSLCPSCNEVKPLKDFKTMSTNAQAKAWGYNRAIEVLSKHCSKCRRPKKKLNELTLKELHTRITSGDIKGGAFGQMLKEDKIAESKRKKREAVEKRWRDARATAWADLLRSSTKEYNRIRKAKDTMQNHEIQAIPKFNTAYHEAICSVRSKFILERKLGKVTANKGKAWWQYIPLAKQTELHELWDSIPATHKQLIKQPQLMKGTTS
jgi:hypothetical protein